MYRTGGFIWPALGTDYTTIFVRASCLNPISTGGRCFPRIFCLPVDNFLILGRLPPSLMTFHNWVLAKFSISKIKNRRFLVAMVTNLSRVVFCQNQ